MAYTTGTATDYHDLLDDLRAWLIGTAGWTELAWTHPTGIDQTWTLQLQGPGNGATARVYVNIQTSCDAGNAMYSWALYGATGYSAGLGMGLQPGAGGPAYLNLWQNSISYWFYANDRRFVVIAKCSTNYMSLYAGFFLPFALPSEYPFPHAIVASYPTMDVCDVSNARNSSIADPGADGAAWYRRRTTEVWQKIENQANSSVSVSPKTGSRAFIWPHKTGRNSSSGLTNDPRYWSTAGFNVMKLNANSEAPLIQCHIVDMADNNIVGALDGVFSTTGFNRSTEQAVTQGGATYRLFQRAYRNQPGDFFAVEEA